jgi:ParB-like chromosome segregation protein Spo0J
MELTAEVAVNDNAVEAVVANTSPLSRRARARAREVAGNQRPWPADKVERWSIDRLIPYAKNARTHSDAQIAAIAASIKEWGWTTPALVGEDGPVMVAAGWSEAQKRALIPYAKNARTHTDAQVAAIAASIKEWGWTSPALVGEDGGLIAGHARILAARQLGIVEIPVMVAAGWSEAQKRVAGGQGRNGGRSIG